MDGRSSAVDDSAGKTEHPVCGSQAPGQLQSILNNAPAWFVWQRNILPIVQYKEHGWPLEDLWEAVQVHGVQLSDDKEVEAVWRKFQGASHLRG